jgi:hypothetical protein
VEIQLPASSSKAILARLICAQAGSRFQARTTFLTTITSQIAAEIDPYCVARFFVGIVVIDALSVALLWLLA